MKQLHWKRLKWPALLMTVYIIFTQIVWLCGWRFNLTESEPLGIYRLAPVNGTVARNAIVEFCPPIFITPGAFPFYMHGTCPGGGMPMFKMVAGIPGDHVQVNMNGVWINNRRLPFSRQLTESRFPDVHLPHQDGSFNLGNDEYWIYGSGAIPVLAAKSFDSRYFGIVTRSMISKIVVD
jgi:conjugative transfer signal peptidase TraF